jgi:hypothetical protein
MRLVDVADWKDASNVRPLRYEDMVLTRYEGKQDCEFVEEAVDPYSIEGLGHIEENCASQSPLVKVPGYSFYEAGEL